MFLVKVKTFGWLLAGFILVIVGVVGFGVSRMVSKNANAANPVATFSSTANFHHIPATDPSVAAALSADNLTEGKTLVGKPVVLLGHITKIFVPAGSPVYLINFAERYRNAFTMVIDAKDYRTFPDPNQLLKKQVMVKGTPFLFTDPSGKEQPEIQLTSLDQVYIVDGTKTNRGK